MDPSLKASPVSQGVERRSRTRIYEPFTVRVRGRDEIGEKYEMDTVLDNLGPGGLYLRLARNVEEGAKLFFLVRLSPSQDRAVFAPLVAIHGEVLRAEPQTDGRCGVAVRFSRRRFV